MAISATPFSGCDCCGYGFEMFEAAEIPYWYLSTLTGGSQELRQILKSDLSVAAVSAFTDAGGIAAIDSQENFYYQVGTSLKKYSFDGTLLWSFVTPPAGQNSTDRHRFTIDSAFNVYVTGTSGSSLRLQKIDSGGNLVWTYDKAPVAGPAGTSASLVGVGVGVALSGNVHVTGGRWLINTPAGTSRVTSHCEIQVDSSGNELWTDISTLTAQGVFESTGLQAIFDEDGNVITRCLAFRSLTGGGATQDNITLKSYDSSGNLLFSHIKSGVGTGTEGEFPSCEMIRYYKGNLYACGPTQNAGETPNTFLKKFNGAEYTTEVWSDDPIAAKRVPRFALSNAHMYAIYFPITPTQTNIRKLNLADGSLVTSSIISGEIPFFPMVPPGNPIQFFR